MRGVGLHNNLTWLSFPSVGSPIHKVFEVELMKRLVQLKGLFISPFGEAIQERSCLSLFARFLNLAQPSICGMSFLLAQYAHVIGSSAARTERESWVFSQSPSQQGHYTCTCSNWGLLPCGVPDGQLAL